MEANEAYIEEIKQIVTEHTPGYYNVIVHQKPYLVEYINNWCCGHDLSKFAEKVYWTVNHMTEFPKCENPGCGKLLTSKQFQNLQIGYRRHCSKKCANSNPLSKQRVAEYNLRVYGCRCTAQAPSVKKKMAETNLKRYGAENVFASEYGKNKIKQYWNEHFGVDNPLQTQRVKDLQASHRKESKRKEYESKRRNHSFNTSKPEETAYQRLCDKFGENNVIRQYSDCARYPFNCDFYIPAYDLFIEYNGSWTHGKHRFNPNNPNDTEVVESWKAKNKKYYDVAIYVWTVNDIRKFEAAERNKLNYVAVYNMNELDDWIHNFSNDKP